MFLDLPTLVRLTHSWSEPLFESVHRHVILHFIHLVTALQEVLKVVYEAFSGALDQIHHDSGGLFVDNARCKLTEQRRLQLFKAAYGVIRKTGIPVQALLAQSGWQ